MDYKEWSDAIDKRVEQARRDYKGPHCCLTMDTGLSKKGSILYYDAQYREYGIKETKLTWGMLLEYCMFCGKKLPKSVRHEWYDILEEEYDLESPDEEDREKVPKEFLTDEWWKKRGL